MVSDPEEAVGGNKWPDDWETLGSKWLDRDTVRVLLEEYEAIVDVSRAEKEEGDED